MSLPGLIPFLRSLLSRLGDEPLTDNDDATPVDVTELLSILPGDMDTYHVQLSRETVLTVNLQADSDLGLRLLDEEAWRKAQTPQGRRLAPCRYSLPSTRNAVVECALEPGDYLLLIWNDSHITANAALELSTPIPGNPSTRSAAVCIDRPSVRA